MPEKNQPQIFYSLAEVNPPQISNRAEMLADIESGKLEYIDFNAQVFKTGQNTNFVTFRDDDLPPFAQSFITKPFLQDHDTYTIDSRQGIIQESAMLSNIMKQTIRLTTRKGMTDYIEGRIDRFSIGWRAEKILCSICGNSYGDYRKCEHIRGNTYDGKSCELIMINPKGIETSAVNNPAVDGTGLLQSMDEMKLSEISGGDTPKINDLSHSGEASSRKGDSKMSETPTNTGGNTPADQLEANRAAAAELMNEQARLQAMDAQLQESQAILIAQCEHLLNSGLAASKLPPVTAARVRKQFEGKAFKAVELQAAISEAREEVAALTASNSISGPARITGMVTSAEHFELAVQDLLGVERDDDKKNIKVHRLTGIREAYILGTGDREFMGGFYPEFALDAQEFPVIVKNAMNKRLVQAWAKYGKAGYDWWQNIVTTEHFNDMKDVDWAVLGTIGSLPTVEKNGEYQPLPIGDNGETSTWEKSGGYIAIALEDFINDDLRVLKKLPDEAALGGIRNISEKVAAIFTANSGAGPTLSDGGALFNATAVTTAGGHANLLTTALGTDYTAWEAVAAAMYNQPMHVKNATGNYGTGKKQAIDPKFWLGPRALRGTANDLFVKRAAGTAYAAASGVTYYGEVVPLTVPEFTDATNWAAVADPNILPGIMLGEIFGLIPQIIPANKETDAAMFANDEWRLKIRHIVTIGIGNWRAIHKSNVAG